MEWTEFHEHIGMLPDEEQEVFNLLWYEQLTHEQAAEVLGVTTRTIRRRWQDARYRLYKVRIGEPLPTE
jgi:RNA polymerase sigma-70 factor (ECF subfamily)